MLFTVSTLILNLFEVENCQGAYKPYISMALFILWESTLVLVLINIRRNLPLVQTGILSTLAHSPVIFSLICYMTMNILNHLQLIYWEVFKVSVRTVFCKSCSLLQDSHSWGTLFRISESIKRQQIYCFWIYSIFIESFVPLKNNFRPRINVCGLLRKWKLYCKLYSQSLQLQLWFFGLLFRINILTASFSSPTFSLVI